VLASEPPWHLPPRIWHKAPPAAPLTGVWLLTASISVRPEGSRVSFHVDGSKDPHAGPLHPLWRSRPLSVRRPATYTEAIPLLSEGLWELSMAFQGIGIRFEQR
jgi:hypothetical protein